MVATTNKMAEAVERVKAELDKQHSQPFRTIERIAVEAGLDYDDVTDAFIVAYPGKLGEYHANAMLAANAIGRPTMHCPAYVRARTAKFTQPELM